MNKLVIGTVFALAATQAAGCVIEEDYATVGATWEIVTLNGSRATCPPGFNTAALFNVATTADGTPVAPCTGPNSVSDTCFVDLFNCEDGVGVSAPLPPTQYLTWVSITDDSGANTYAQSLSAYLNVSNIDLDFNTSIVTNGGYFALDWTLRGATSNLPKSCGDVGAVAVETYVTSGTTMYDSGAPWNCGDGYGVTAALGEGSYLVSVNANNSAGFSLGVAPEFTNKVIQAPNKVTDLGTAVIAIDGM